MSMGVNYANYQLPPYTPSVMTEQPAPMPMTLVEKLRFVENLKPGDHFPDWMGGYNGWGPPLSQLCKEAADKIEALEKFERLQEMIDNYPK